MVFVSTKSKYIFVIDMFCFDRFYCNKFHSTQTTVVKEIQLGQKTSDPEYIDDIIQLDRIQKLSFSWNN